VVERHSQHGCSGCHCPTQHLDDASGHDVPGAIVDDVGLLVALVVTGLRVRVAVDDLDHPLGVLELHLLLLVALVGNMLLGFPLAGRHSIAVWLPLLLLVELLHELLDLLVHLDTVAPRVAHRAPRPAIVTARRLAWPLVISWPTTPTNHCNSSSSNDSGCSDQLRVVAAGLLLVVVLVLAATQSIGI
jgi:hypothetical protein